MNYIYTQRLLPKISKNQYFFLKYFLNITGIETQAKNATSIL